MPVWRRGNPFRIFEKVIVLWSCGPSALIRRCSTPPVTLHMEESTRCRGSEVVQRLALERIGCPTSGKKRHGSLAATRPAKLPGSGRHLRTLQCASCAFSAVGPFQSDRLQPYAETCARHPAPNPKSIDPIPFDLESGTRPLLLTISGSGAWNGAAANTITFMIY